MPATVKDSARDRDPLPLFPRGETLPGVESHHPYHPAASKQASRQASKQASKQGGIRQLHHDVTAARHKGNNRAKRGTSHRPLAPAGKKGTRKGRADWHCPVPGRWATLMARKALSGGGQGKEPLGPYAVGANKRGIRRAPDQLSRVSTTLASLSVSFTWLSSTKRRSGAMPWVSTRYSLVFWARRMARFRRDLAVMSC